MPLGETLPPDSYKRARKHIADGLSSIDSSSSDELKVIELEENCKDGSTIHVEAKVKFLRNEKGWPIGVIGITRDITARKKAEEEREHLIVELRRALEQIKRLSGLLPICASCKKIRADDGYWQDVAVYIQKHSEADLSHGICPDCLDYLYPKFRKRNAGNA